MPRDRGALGRAVALDDDDPERLPGELEVGRQGRPATGDRPELPAEALEDRAEEEAPDADRQAEGDPPDLVEPVESAVAGRLGLDPVHQELEQLGYRGDHGHPVAPHGRHQGGGGEGRQEGQLRAGHEAVEEGHDLAVHVRERDEGEGPLAVDPGREGDRPGVVDHLAVGQHHALRVARRAAREEDLGERVRLTLTATGIGWPRHAVPCRLVGSVVPGPLEQRLGLDPQDGGAEGRRVPVAHGPAGQGQDRPDGPPDPDRHVGRHPQVERDHRGAQPPDRESRRRPARGRWPPRSRPERRDRPRGLPA